MVYALPIPNDTNCHITQLEMLNVVVALKIWAESWANCSITILCDNQAVVEVLNSGKTKDMFLATCVRNAWLITSMYNIRLQVVHIPGRHNQVAGLLSRWSITHEPARKLQALMPNHVWISTHTDLLLNNNI